MKSFKILITGILFIIVFISLFILYRETLIKYLYHNDIFEPGMESFDDFAYINANYKFYIWESDRLEYDGSIFENRTLEFVSDSIPVPTGWKAWVDYSR